MRFNGKPYYDHPPIGFWLMATSYKIFGINEFSTRFPSAMLGLFSIILLYKIAEVLFRRKEIGFIASLILGTSVWYVIRVRTGDLDSTFIFFYLLTIYFSIKSAKNIAWFPLVMLSFGSLILAKTLAGITAAIPITLLHLFNFRNFRDIRKTILFLGIGIFCLFIAVYPWYHLHLQKYSEFYNYHFIHIGRRDKNLSSFLQVSLEKPLFYLHMGVRKWYKLWQLALVMTIINLFALFFSWRKKPKKEILSSFISYLILLIWNFIVLYPFLAAKEVEIWHLIPTYLPMSLLVAAIFYDIGSMSYHFLFQNFRKHLVWYRLIYLSAFLFLAIVQIVNFRKEIYPQSRYTSEQVDISRRLSKYQQKIYVDGDYLPVAVFYSTKQINSLVYESSGTETFNKLFAIDNGDVIGVTQNWVIDDLRKKNFFLKVLEKNSKYSIIAEQ